MSTGYKYNPSTGKWELVQGSDPPNKAPTKDPAKDDKGSGGTNTPPPTSSSPQGTQSANDKERKEGFNDVNINILKADLMVNVSKETFNLKSGDTVSVSGVGKHLSGNYLVMGNVFTITADSGLEQTLHVSKFEVEKSLKPQKLPLIVPAPPAPPAPPITPVAESKAPVHVAASKKVTTTRKTTVSGNRVNKANTFIRKKEKIKEKKLSKPNTYSIKVNNINTTISRKSAKVEKRLSPKPVVKKFDIRRVDMLKWVTTITENTKRLL